MMNALGVLGAEDKFDAIIVDEGQDFRELWWTSMDSLFRDPENKGCYFVFYDPKQNVFATSASLPSELGEPFDLPMNCRNTVKIAEHCAGLIGIESNVLPSAPAGDEPEILKSADFKEAFRLAAKKVNEWCQAGKGGLKSSQVAVLAPSSQKDDCPDKFGSVPMTTKFDDWRNDQGVLFSSAKRFKGLEADAVVILCHPPEEPDELMEQYVARSRAKHVLVVIEVEKAVD
jgi:superfamily I DNA/RNA helicase